MLTRLKVDGFKNLNGLDVRFGPFTCIAGANGIGKSNIFDAITFLAALAQKPLLEAALSVRGVESRGGDPRALFSRNGDAVSSEMSFEAEMLVPQSGEDELGQAAEASMTFLRYSLRLGWTADDPSHRIPTLHVLEERLVHINKGDAKETLAFPHSTSWRDSAVVGRRTSDFISTIEDNGSTRISLHSDMKGGGGRPRQVLAETLPRTMLSSATNAAEHRTLVLVRREMASWVHLQLEPSALRAPDGFSAPHSVGSRGEHLPSTLHFIANEAERVRPGGRQDVLAELANRLSELVGNVKGLDVEVDEKRQTLSIVMEDLAGTLHPASSLSDGTLRFMALLIMRLEPSPRTVLCIEEPENGIHPQRLPNMLGLLEELAVDVHEPVSADNPLRQVIINTHSPGVVKEVVAGELLVASASRGDGDAWKLRLDGLPGTWRTKLAQTAGVPLLKLLELLGASRLTAADSTERSTWRRRVRERSDVQGLLFPPDTDQ